MSPRINWIINNVNGKKILDIGFAGSEDEHPTLFLQLREKFPKSEIIGLDNNFSKVKKLKLPKTVVGDIRKIPFPDNSFDTIVIGELMEHVYFWQDMLIDPARVLKKGGQLLLTTPNPFGFFRYLRNYLLPADLADKKNVREYLGYHDHKAFYDPLSIANALYDAGFKKVSFTSTNLSLPFIPNKWRNPGWGFWPLSRLGTYSCFLAVK